MKLRVVWTLVGLRRRGLGRIGKWKMEIGKCSARSNRCGWIKCNFVIDSSTTIVDKAEASVLPLSADEAPGVGSLRFAKYKSKNDITCGK